MIRNVIFSPVFSLPILIGLAILGFIAIWVTYRKSKASTGPWRTSFLSLLRFFVLACVLIILARPMMLEPEPTDVQRPSFSVLLDSSLSMNTKDVDEQSRFTMAKTSLLKKRSPSLLDTLAEHFNVQLYRFDESIHAQSLPAFTDVDKANGKETRMAEALMAVTQTHAVHKPKGILLLSDGRINGPSERVNVINAAQTLRMMKIPVWTVPLGQATEAKDVYIVSNLSGGYLLADQPGSIRVSVFGNGYNNQTVTLTCYREDRALSTAQVFLKNGYAEVDFPVQEPHRGVYQYRVEAETFADEADMHNNSRYVIARVLDEKVRVLVVEASVHWDSKFLLRALRSDLNVEATSIFHVNRQKTFAVVEKVSEDNALTKTVVPGVKMPQTLDALRHYDCIFLGKNMVDVFSGNQLKMIFEYVSTQGGSVVFFRDKSYEVTCPELEALEPLRWGQGHLDDVQFELTDAGKANPIFQYGGETGETIIRELPGMASVTRVSGHKSLAVILAQTKDRDYGGQMATVAYQRYGKGKVMSIGASGLWRWGFLPERLKEYDEIHARFWGQMIRWLVSDSEFLPGQNISFVADRHSYGADELVRLAISARNVDHQSYQPKIEMILPDGKSEFLSVGNDAYNQTLYSAQYSPSQLGAYQAILHNNIGVPEQDVIRFTVYNDSAEARCVHADPDLLEQISKTTGADVLALDEINSLPEKIRNFEKLSKERVKPHDIWDRGQVFACLVGLLGLEWLMRRRWGLV